jgi:hypothetical protein
MNRCPSCGATGGLALTPVLVARPAGSYSLSGAQHKTAAVDAARLSCAACGFTATGRIEGLEVAGDGTITGGHLVIDQPPPTTPPAGPSAGEAPTHSHEDRPRRFWSAALGRHVTIPDNQDDPRVTRPSFTPPAQGRRPWRRYAHPACIAVEPVTAPRVGVSHRPEPGGSR